MAARGAHRLRRRHGTRSRIGVASDRCVRRDFLVRDAGQLASVRRAAATFAGPRVLAAGQSAPGLAAPRRGVGPGRRRIAEPDDRRRESMFGASENKSRSAGFRWPGAANASRARRSNWGGARRRSGARHGPSGRVAGPCGVRRYRRHDCRHERGRHDGNVVFVRHRRRLLDRSLRRGTPSRRCCFVLFPAESNGTCCTSIAAGSSTRCCGNIWGTLAWSSSTFR